MQKSKYFAISQSAQRKVRAEDKNREIFVQIAYIDKGVLQAVPLKNKYIDMAAKHRKKMQILKNRAKYKY